MTRVSKAAAVVLLALTLSLSAPSAFAAAQRGAIGDPGWGTRIVRIIKSVIHHLIPASLDDFTGTQPPIPTPPPTTP